LDKEHIFSKRIFNAAEKACKTAGISLSQVSAVCGCLNGADWDFEYPILEKELKEIFCIKDVIVLNDCIGAMRGGSSSPQCSVICAGTALNAAVRRADGKEIIYGYFIDSAHQGAEALGSRALRKVMESYIGVCGETMLSNLVLEHTGHDSAEQLLIDMTAHDYKLAMKDLAPLMLKAYAAGDVEAVKVVEEVSKGMARYITAGMKRLEISGQIFELVFSGSVFKDVGTLMADRIFNIVTETEPNARKVHARYEPVCGAVLTLLDRLYNCEIPKKVDAVFSTSAQAYGLLRNLKISI